MRPVVAFSLAQSLLKLRKMRSQVTTQNDWAHLFQNSIHVFSVKVMDAHFVHMSYRTCHVLSKKNIFTVWLGRKSSSPLRELFRLASYILTISVTVRNPSWVNLWGTYKLGIFLILRTCRTVECQVTGCNKREVPIMHDIGRDITLLDSEVFCWLQFITIS